MEQEVDDHDLTEVRKCVARTIENFAELKKTSP